MALWIRNGTIVNDDCIFKGDIIIEDGIISAVGNSLPMPRDLKRTIDAKDRFVMPGGIDPHTHFQLPFMGLVSVDDFYVGSRAALAGGTTMFIDFVIPQKTETPLATYSQWRDWADSKVCCDYGLSVAITTYSEAIQAEMRMLVRPEYGINSFKFFMACSEFMLSDDELYRAMIDCSKLGALARVHAENGLVIIEKQKELLRQNVTGPEGHSQSRPEQLEAEATNRACVLATQANCPLYVVHVMSKGAARAIAEHRQRGCVVFGEPIAASLATDGSHYYHEDWCHAAAYVLSPPLSEDRKTPSVLMDLLACGQLHLTATDNCTFTREQKMFGKDDFTKIPNGVNGVEDRMSIVWEKGVHQGKIDPMQFVAITSLAKVFLEGRIAVGSDADVIIWNGNATRTISAETHHHACDFNIFEGMTVHGVCEITISRGEIVWEDGELNVKRGDGRFISLPPFSSYCFATILQRAQLMAPRTVPRYSVEEAVNQSAEGIIQILMSNEGQHVGRFPSRIFAQHMSLVVIASSPSRRCRESERMRQPPRTDGIAGVTGTTNHIFQENNVPEYDSHRQPRLLDTKCPSIKASGMKPRRGELEFRPL